MNLYTALGSTDNLTILIFQCMTWNYVCSHQFLFSMSSHFHYLFFTHLGLIYSSLVILFDAAMSVIVSLISLSDTLLLGPRNAIYLDKFISNPLTSLISLKF